MRPWRTAILAGASQEIQCFLSVLNAIQLEVSATLIEADLQQQISHVVVFDTQDNVLAAAVRSFRLHTPPVIFEFVLCECGSGASRPSETLIDAGHLTRVEYVGSSVLSWLHPNNIRAAAHHALHASEHARSPDGHAQTAHGRPETARSDHAAPVLLKCLGR